jgi:cytochrome bd-type quinol oxidase subunit 2
MNQVFARPVGCGAHRAPALPVVAYGIGVLAGGVATGVALAALGQALGAAIPGILHPFEWAAGLALVAFAAVLQRRGTVAPLAQRHAQVPRRWTLWSSRVRLGVAFGFILGAGMFTYLHHATAYALGVLLLLSPTPIAGAFAGVCYGATRALLLAVAWAWPRRLDAGGDLSVGLSSRATTALPAVAGAAAVLALFANFE